MSRWEPDPTGSVISRTPVSWPVLQDYGSADPDPKEVFADPQHCFPSSLEKPNDLLNVLEMIRHTVWKCTVCSWERKRVQGMFEKSLLIYVEGREYLIIYEQTFLVIWLFSWSRLQFLVHVESLNFQTLFCRYTSTFTNMDFCSHKHFFHTECFTYSIYSTSIVLLIVIADLKKL